jgi:hypothetical protein
MSNNPASIKERSSPNTLRSIDDLRRNDEISRLDLLAKRTDGTERNDSFNTEMLQSSDVCSGGDIGR